jgi:hypothetical protein
MSLSLVVWTALGVGGLSRTLGDTGGVVFLAEFAQFLCLVICGVGKS